MKQIKLRGWLRTQCPKCLKAWKTEQDERFKKISKKVKGKNIYD